MRIRMAAAIAVASICIAAGPAATPAPAHGGGNPNFRSEVHGFSQPEPGIAVSVLGYDDRMEIVNSTHKVVVVYGYDDEPFARILPDGTVQTNVRSPATYLNDDRLANVEVPAAADPDAPPQWKTVSDGGVLEWHDHRMHWMSTAVPPEVTDESVETKIFDYRIPVSVDGQRNAINGTLFWVGSDSGSKTPALVVGLAIIVLGGAGVLWLRHRRRSTGDGSGDGEDGAAEAW